jgi:hypothetical protein
MHAATQLALEKGGVDLQTGRNAAKDGCEPGAVALARSVEGYAWHGAG